jgi:hypothetical protein
LTLATLIVLVCNRYSTGMHTSTLGHLCSHRVARLESVRALSATGRGDAAEMPGEP